MLNPKTFRNAAAYWWSQIGLLLQSGQSQECPEFCPFKLFPPGSVLRSAWTQHRLNMEMKCLQNSKTQYLAIQFADFLQATSRILTSLLFSLTWSSVSLYTQGYFLTIVLQTCLQYKHCRTAAQQLIESWDQDINMLPTQSYSIPRLTKSPWPILGMPTAKLPDTTLITRLDETPKSWNNTFSQYRSKWISLKLSWLHPTNIWWYLRLDHSQWLTWL